MIISTRTTNKKQETMVHIPEDILTNILSMLPVKSIFRFKSVSKPWCTLMENSDFIKLHHNNIPKKFATLLSSDGKAFEVDEGVAYQSQTIKHMIEDGCHNYNVIPVPDVTAAILVKVIEYCRRHVDDEAMSASWDAAFVNLDPTTLLHLASAAYNLSIMNLVDLTCQALVDIIKDMSLEEVRNIFNIVNDLTPEEEA